MGTKPTWEIAPYNYENTTEDKTLAIFPGDFVLNIFGSDINIYSSTIRGHPSTGLRFQLMIGVMKRSQR